MAYFLTQCPFCQTSFKVSEEQMHVANGVVRCGSCREVFLAGQHRIVLKDKTSRPDLFDDGAPATDAPADDLALAGAFYPDDRDDMAEEDFPHQAAPADAPVATWPDVDDDARDDDEDVDDEEDEEDVDDWEEDDDGPAFGDGITDLDAGEDDDPDADDGTWGDIPAPRAGTIPETRDEADDSGDAAFDGLPEADDDEGPWPDFADEDALDNDDVPTREAPVEPDDDPAAPERQRPPAARVATPAPGDDDRNADEEAHLPDTGHGDTDTGDIDPHDHYLSERPQGPAYNIFLDPSGYRMNRLTVDHDLAPAAEPATADAKDEPGGPGEASDLPDGDAWVFEEEPDFPAPDMLEDIDDDDGNVATFLASGDADDIPARDGDLVPDPDVGFEGATEDVVPNGDDDRGFTVTDGIEDASVNGDVAATTTDDNVAAAAGSPTGPEQPAPVESAEATGDTLPVRDEDDTPAAHEPGAGQDGDGDRDDTTDRRDIDEGPDLTDPGDWGRWQDGQEHNGHQAGNDESAWTQDHDATASDDAPARTGEPEAPTPRPADNVVVFLPPRSETAGTEDASLAPETGPGEPREPAPLPQPDDGIPVLVPDEVAREDIPAERKPPHDMWRRRPYDPAPADGGLDGGAEAGEAGDGKAALRASLSQLADEDSLEPLGDASLAAIDASPIEIVATRTSRSGLETAAWILASLLLVTALAGQYLWYNLDTLVRTNRLPAVTAQLCRFTTCPDPDAFDLSALVTEELVVRSHPQVKDALLVDFIFRNDANREQRFPLVELNFTNNNGRVLANRVFSAGEYLPPEMTLFTHMPAHSSIQVSLALVDPGPEATGYSLAFRRP